ncbi:MutS-related protein [Mucilaginibacter lacusdianchii]|uniref:MutS-related protein n=1 Tax=Mucilaginibacter lacusdianchii TaxID=2684211 RepID=UPI00131C34C6|nr:DNA mismatch repair protein MutS [Mucilaginibacter sp. JXJ CY 39]
MPSPVIPQYQNHITHAEQQIGYYQKKINTYSVLRLVVFGGFLALIYWSIKWDSLALFAVATLVLGVLFRWLVGRQNWFEKQKSYFQNFQIVNQNEIDSITEHVNIYDDGLAFNNDKHYYTSDLDVFGAGSLFQLINRAATNAGRNILAGWLQKPAGKAVVLSRQEAIKELGNKTDWKLNMQSLLLFANSDDDKPSQKKFFAPGHPMNTLVNRKLHKEKSKATDVSDELSRLFNYLHTPLNIKGEAWLSKYIIIEPIVMVLAIVIAIYIPPVKYVAIGIAVLNYIINSANAKYTQQTDVVAGHIGTTLKNYADVFGSIEQETWSSAYCISLAARVKPQDGKSMSATIRQLSSHITNLNARLVMFLGAILNGLLLWNVRYVLAIEKWKRDNHHNIEAAFGSIAEFEALLSLTSLHVNNPEWCFPEIAEGDTYTLTAQSIAHPLIKATIRVANDYELKDTFKIDLITGSNMAGKSTFLRTLGINTVLALAGAPVCATAMQVSVVQLFSYMRIKDSLNESTSTFKAELDRLQMLLAAVNGQNKIFFLIDEMLRGTNSVDKYRGSKAVIEQLIARQGVGLVATHDLQLAELETKYPNYVRNFYFDIQVQNGEMLFDYKLKLGECKTFNASLLLKQIGIPLND